MKQCFLILPLLLAALPVMGQGLVRRADTLLQVLSINPTNFAIADRLMYLAVGRNTPNDGEALFIDWDKTNTLATNATDIFGTLANTGRWVVQPVLSTGSGGGGTLSNAVTPLYTSAGLIYLLPLTNWFNFLAGSGISLTPTSNSLTIASTAGPRFTIDGQFATNIWNNNLIIPMPAGGGNFSLEVGNESLGTNKITTAFYNWLLSNFGSGGGTTNGFGVNGTFRTDWNFINSAAIAATLSGGTNWYLSIEDASINTNKIDSTFRAWIESMGGGGGGGDAYLANTQTFTGASNIFENAVYVGTLYGDELVITTLDIGTNLIARANGGTGADTSAYGVGLFGSNGSNNTIDVDTEAELETAVGVDLIAVVTDDITSANLRTALSDETGTGAAVFVGGDLGSGTTATTASAGASNSVVATTAYVDRAVATGGGGGGGGTTDNVVQWIGSAYFVITNNSTTGDFSLLQTNGVVTSASVIDGQNDAPVVVELGFPSRSTNYLWTAMFEESVSGNVAYESEGGRTATSLRLKMHNAGGSVYFTGGYWVRIDLYDKASVSGGSSESGGATDAMARFWTSTFGKGAFTWMIAPRGSASFANLRSGVSAISASATSVPATANTPVGNRYTSTTSGANNGGVEEAALSHSAWLGTNAFFVSFGGNGSTSNRFHLGFYSATPLLSDTPANGYGLRFSGAGGAGDTNWRFISNDGATTNNVNTGVAYTNDAAIFVAFARPTQTNVVAYINGVAVGTNSYTQTTNSLLWYVAGRSLNTVTNAITIYQAGGEFSIP